MTTPTDRELIEFAAKAAGKTRGEWDAAWLRDLGHNISRDMLWNPLADNGAVFVLALQLGIQFWRDDDLLWVGVRCFKIASSADVAALARLEVTRAAYEIGKAMP